MIISEVDSEKSLGAMRRESTFELWLSFALRGGRMAAQATAGHVAEPRRLCLGARHVIDAESIAFPARMPAVAQDTPLRFDSLNRRIEFRVLADQRAGGKQGQDHERKRAGVHARISSTPGS
jgi:hypothetical protein